MVSPRPIFKFLRMNLAIQQLKSVHKVCGTWPRLKIKAIFPDCGNRHYEIGWSWLPYGHNGNSYVSKTVSLYQYYISLLNTHCRTFKNGNDYWQKDMVLTIDKKISWRHLFITTFLIYIVQIPYNKDIPLLGNLGIAGCGWFQIF